jgi:hypothetical protein
MGLLIGELAAFLPDGEKIPVAGISRMVLLQVMIGQGCQFTEAGILYQV